MDVNAGLVLKGLPLLLALPLALAGAYLISRLYQRETATVSGHGSKLRLLRGAVVALLVILLTQPVIHSVTVERETPVVIVLRDTSPSMTVKDTHKAPELRVREAVALGLLENTVRDTHAGQAGEKLTAAQRSFDTALAGIKLAVQLMQESAANAGNARERIKASCDALGMAGDELARAAEQIKGAEQAAALRALIDAQTAAAQKLKTSLTEIAIERPEGQSQLAARSQAAVGLAPEIARSIAEAQRLQDVADRTLALSQNPMVKAALEKLDSIDRVSVVKAMIDGQTIPKVSNQVRVVQYAFDTDLHEIPLSPAVERRATDTDLATPLIHLAERHAQDSVAAVVICSDGRHTSGPPPEDAARLLAARGIAVHTLGVGGEDAPPDICVASLDGTQSVFIDESIRLTAHIRTSGYKGQKCRLELARGTQTVQSRELTIAGDGWMHEDFEFPADKAGANVFTASIKPLPGEALTNNNSAETVVDVANDKLKVLLVDELPRWETRYLASLLRRERKMVLDERWLLTGDLGPKASALPSDDRALEDYEIIVLGDVPAERLSETDQKRLAGYVADRGGFLVLIGGPKAMPQSYSSGPIADLLPIRQQQTGAPPASGASEHAHVKLDPSSISHEITRILRDPVLNEKLWPALPELRWVVRPAYAKPLATPLLETDDARKDVVVAVQNYGAGRVVYSGTDSTWNWRYKVADRIHAVFWSQAMRWGTSNRLSGGPRLKIGCDRRQVRPGESIEILARPRDSSGKTVPDAVVWAEMGEAAHVQRAQLQPVPDSGGLYRGYIQNIEPGTHTIRVQVTSAGFEGVKQELQIIAREIAGQEGIELSRDSGRLAEIAKAGGGKYMDILKAPELFKELASQGRERTIEYNYEIWSSYPVLAIFVILLSAEWILRKRLGLA
jgi:hypothetical protein